MKRATREIKRLIEVNAKHRKGFRLGEVGLPFILRQADAELQELCESPNDPDEMADLLGILIHYAIRKGWTEKYLEDILLDKLKLRFSEETT